MKTYKMKIGESEMYVVEMMGMPFMFDTQEKAEDYIKRISSHMTISRTVSKRYTPV